MIVTGYGACLDFCNEDNSTLFASPATVSSVELPDIGPSSDRLLVGRTRRRRALDQILRRVVDDPAVLDDLPGRGGTLGSIVSDFTWQASASIAAERLTRAGRPHPVPTDPAKALRPSASGLPGRVSILWGRVSARASAAGR